jgi:hypothetical protein
MHAHPSIRPRPHTQYTPRRFKAKAKATGGDVKGRSRVEPYAYWQFDRKMLNRRKAKHEVATKSLGTVVRAVKIGAAKGGKAKGQAAAAKRQRAGATAGAAGEAAGAGGAAAAGVTAMQE